MAKGQRARGSNCTQTRGEKQGRAKRKASGCEQEMGEEERERGREGECERSRDLGREDSEVRKRNT